jgi:predicted NBD/HSP70 family sugar kinase
MIGAHGLVRRTHEERILQTLRAHGALSRGEIAERVGLSRTTLSEITGSLLERGAVIVLNTDAAVREGSGRPAERLALDPASGQYLGVDFGHRRVSVAVSDASHEVIATGIERYSEDTTWDERIELAFALTERLSRETGVHFGALQGVGLGVPGPHTPMHDGTEGARARWHAMAHPDGIENIFASRFRTSVVVDNNTRFAALAEAIHVSADGSDDVVYLRLSDGVGGGLVVAGRLVIGAAGFAGELGHVTADPAGVLCRCGKRGCLETIASVPAILASCRAAGLAVTSLDELATAVTRQDPVADAVLRAVGSTIGRVLGAAAMLLNPAQIVIGGEIATIAPVLIEQAARTIGYELYSIPTQGPVVRPAQLGENDGALGAIAALFHNSPLLASYPPKRASESPVQMQRSAQ